MSDAKVRGKVHVIEATKTYGQNGFRKRLVVLEQESDRFTNYIPVEFIQDACDTADELKVGAEVEIDYRLNGRKWQKDAKSEVKFFLNAEALGFRVLEGGEAGSPATSTSANDALAEAGQVDEEDIPF
jgi:hypothetical protein